jgi:hypothetical protein
MSPGIGSQSDNDWAVSQLSLYTSMTTVSAASIPAEHSTIPKIGQ